MQRFFVNYPVILDFDISKRFHLVLWPNTYTHRKSEKQRDITKTPPKCKIQKNWCTVTVAPTIEHHDGHSRTPANQRWDQVPRRSRNFDYTTISDCLRMVSLSNESYPTCVVKPVYGITTFPLTTSCVIKRTVILKFVNNHPYKDLSPRVNQSGEAIEIITRTCKVITTVYQTYNKSKREKKKSEEK